MNDPVWESKTNLVRIGSAVAKYWLSKRSIAVVSEALECIGGVTWKSQFSQDFIEKLH